MAFAGCFSLLAFRAHTLSTPAGHVPAASREGLDLAAFPLCCILALQTHEDLGVGFLEQSEHGLEGGHDPVVAAQACSYHRLSLASMEQLMAEPARPWMGGLDSAAAQPWTSHLPGTSAGQRSWVLAAAGGQCHQECTQSMARRDETAQSTAGKGREGTGRGRKPPLGLWSSSCKAKVLRGPSQPGRNRACRARGMSPSLVSHPIPTLWHPQDVPKGEGLLGTLLLGCCHPNPSTWVPFPMVWPPYSQNMATLLLGCGHSSPELGLKLHSKVVSLGQTSP